MKKTTRLELFKKLAKQIDYDSILEKEIQDNQYKDKQDLINRLCDMKIAYDKAKERLQDGSTLIRVNLEDL